MGRPKKDIDAKEVEKLAGLGCTYEEIASVLGCHKSTLSRRFATETTRGHDNLKMSIRRWQYNSAKSGNVRMLIHLGKVYLDQGDNPVIIKERDVETTAVVRDLRQTMFKDNEYAEWLRETALSRDANSSPVGSDGKQGQVGDGTSPGNGRPGSDGRGKRKRS